MAVHLTLTEGVEVRVLTGQQRGIYVPLLNIVRWRNGNAMFLDEVQPGEAVEGSSPSLTTNVIRLTAKNRINGEYHMWLQTHMIYK